MPLPGESAAEGGLREGIGNSRRLAVRVSAHGMPPRRPLIGAVQGRIEQRTVDIEGSLVRVGEGPDTSEVTDSGKGMGLLLPASDHGLILGVGTPVDDGRPCQAQKLPKGRGTQADEYTC